MTACYCDFEGPEFYNKRTPVARKPRECCECGSEIKAGERYEYVTGKWEGRLDSFTTCMDCVDVREALAEMPCFCWSHGGLQEDVQQQFADARFTPGERFAYLRVVVKHRKINQKLRQQ